MALLLKLAGDVPEDGQSVVTRMKSAALAPADIGQTVYVWSAGDDGRGALHGRAVLAAYDALKLPQPRDPSKLKDAYRLTLAPDAAQVTAPLTTADLGPAQPADGADGIDSLGRINRDGDDRIIRLTSAEAAVLAGRFQH